MASAQPATTVEASATLKGARELQPNLSGTLRFCGRRRLRLGPQARMAERGT